MSTPGWCVCLGGVCSSGVCSWGGCYALGVSAPRGCLLPGGLLLGGVSAPGGGIPACTEADPPVSRITDACKKITFVAAGNEVDRSYIRTFELFDV